MTAHWPRARLSDRDLEAIHATRWRRFSTETVIAIAEAWNAGLLTRPMARDLKCRPGSVRILIGRLSQRGVAMRLADEALFPAKPSLVPATNIKRAAAVIHIDRLNRLAAFDPMLARASKQAQRDLRRMG